MLGPIKKGRRVPPATLAELVGGSVSTVGTQALLAGKRSLIIGVPGAFTPICHQVHLPDFVAMADQFRAAGFQQLLVIAASDPFALAAWSSAIDPEGRLRFLSDGNLELTRKLGLTSREPALFLGERSCRYTMVVQDAVVERLSVETSILDVTCTRADVVELAA